MKSISIAFRDREYHLAFNGAAMFAIGDEFGTTNVFELLQDGTIKEFENICKLSAILSEQGELIRRYNGQDNGPILKAEELAVMASPNDVMTLKRGVINAVIAGYGREVEEDEEQDGYLAEIEKKTESN